MKCGSLNAKAQFIAYARCAVEICGFLKAKSENTKLAEGYVLRNLHAVAQFSAYVNVRHAGIYLLQESVNWLLVMVGFVLRSATRQHMQQ